MSGILDLSEDEARLLGCEIQQVPVANPPHGYVWHTVRTFSALDEKTVAIAVASRRVVLSKKPVLDVSGRIIMYPSKFWHIVTDTSIYRPQPSMRVRIICRRDK